MRISLSGLCALSLCHGDYNATGFSVSENSFCEKMSRPVSDTILIRRTCRKAQYALAAPKSGF